MVQLRFRVLIGMMIFLGYFILCLVRYNLSVHIIDMSQILVMSTNPRLKQSFPRRAFRYDIQMNRAYLDTVIWSDSKIGRLLCAYHLGFCICLPIFHNVGDKLGPTWLVGMAGVMSGVLNCLTPAATYYDFWTVFIVRVFMGFCAGAMQPSMLKLLKHWVPPIERNHFLWAYCGNTMGTVATFIFCTFIQYYSHWPTGFYAVGIIQIAWALLWLSIVTDKPQKHPYISPAELEYLNNSITTTFSIKVTNMKAPWKRILTSLQFWALCALNLGHAWIFLAIALHGPLFYFTAVQYSVYNASLLTALPFLIRLILGTAVIHFYHWYKYNISHSKAYRAHKYLTIVSHILPGIIITCFWFTTLTPGPVTLTLAISLTAVGMDLTFEICYVLTPNFGNVIYTVIKIISTAPGIFLPLGVAAVISKYSNKEDVWQNIWCFHGLILLLSGLVFLIWGEVKVQTWNNIPRKIIRPPRHLLPRPSTMSNILETDEEESSSYVNTSARVSRQFASMKSFFTKSPFRRSQDVQWPSVSQLQVQAKDSTNSESSQTDT